MAETEEKKTEERRAGESAPARRSAGRWRSAARGASEVAVKRAATAVATRGGPGGGRPAWRRPARRRTARNGSRKADRGSASTWTTRRTSSSAACATWIQARKASCAASITRCAERHARPENERQHEFVMVRARLAYTIARHSLRSLDALERLLLQVTRKNDTRGYERFRDLFEAIIAYNE